MSPGPVHYGTCPTPETNFLSSNQSTAAASTSVQQLPIPPNPKTPPIQATSHIIWKTPPPQQTTSRTRPPAADPGPASRSTSNTRSTAGACATPRPKSALPPCAAYAPSTTAPANPPTARARAIGSAHASAERSIMTAVDGDQL